MVGKLGIRLLVGVPTTKAARRSTTWIESLANLQMPLGSSMARMWVEDRPIAEARNHICSEALRMGCQYVFMVSDDVITPPNTILLMLDKIGRTFPISANEQARASMLTGVYWTKTYPPEPYLWNDLLKGSYRDWKAGEFFPVDMAGCDCLMIETEMLKTLPYPWFSQEWVWEHGQPVSSIATEDFYFYIKAKKHGFRLFADTSIQCWHEDRDTGQMYGLLLDMPQCSTVQECGEDELLIADLGAGTDGPYFGANCKVTRFDARSDVKPDVQCDIAQIPAEHYGKYDLVHARHVLEHFSRDTAPSLIREWAKLCKVGGTLKIRVPNLGWAIKTILEAEPDGSPTNGAHNAQTQNDLKYAWQQLYGGQVYALDYHMNGFTARKLAALLQTHPHLADIAVVEEDSGQNLCATATLVRQDVPDALLPWWEQAHSGASLSPSSRVSDESLGHSHPAPVHSTEAEEIPPVSAPVGGT